MHVPKLLYIISANAQQRYAQSFPIAILAATLSHPVGKKEETNTFLSYNPVLMCCHFFQHKANHQPVLFFFSCALKCFSVVGLVVLGLLAYSLAG